MASTEALRLNKLTDLFARRLLDLPERGVVPLELTLQFDRSKELLAPLMKYFDTLPKTLFDSYPYRSSAVASNGDLIRLPVHARKFGLVYVEGRIADGYQELSDVLKKAGIRSHQPFTPEGPENGKAADVAFYGIEFEDGDIGQYKEFFLLIKLSSQKSSVPGAPNDMFVWHLAVDSAKAAAWGSPWHYPKKTIPEGTIGIEFDADHIAESLRLDPWSDPNPTTYKNFPGLLFKRGRAPEKEPIRWSHEEQWGDGFDFVNPATERQPNGFLAPIQNQGEAWIDTDLSSHTIEFSRLTDDFRVLERERVEWSYVFYGRNFQAIAFEGYPIRGSLHPAPPSVRPEAHPDF